MSSAKEGKPGAGSHHPFLRPFCLTRSFDAHRFPRPCHGDGPEAQEAGVPGGISALPLGPAAPDHLSGKKDFLPWSPHPHRRTTYRNANLERFHPTMLMVFHLGSDEQPVTVSPQERMFPV